MLDLIEGSDHTDNGTQESERRSDRDEEGDPREVFLQETELYATIRSNSLLYYVDTLIVTAQALIEDRSYRTASIAANIQSLLDTTLLESSLDISKQLFRVSFAKLKINNTLDTHSQPEYQGNEC